jgi:hypothetical protein
LLIILFNLKRNAPQANINENDEYYGQDPNDQEENYEPNNDPDYDANNEYDYNQDENNQRDE